MKNIFLASFAVAVCFSAPFFSLEALATPAEIILIRHGEKPATGNDLNERGYQRANALVGFFETDARVTRFGLPVAIYAMAPKQGGGSLRAIETVAPLAKSLNLSVNDNYTRPEVQAVANEILNNPAFDGRMVLICWEHAEIPPLAQALGATLAPLSWKGSVFDRAWVIDFSGDQVSSFQDLAQHLLPGDSNN